MPFKSFLKFCVIFIPVPVALVLIFYTLMPKVVETVVLQKIKQIEALSDLEFDISHIGFSGINIRDIQKGERLKADSLFIGYSLKSLVKKRVERIAISGLRLDIDSHDAGNVPARQKEFDLKALLEPVLAYMGKTGSIEVQNSALTVNVLGRSLHVPVEARLDFNTKQRKMVLSGQVFAFSQKIEINAAADFNGDLEMVDIQADDFMLGHISPFVSLLDPDLSVSGETDIRIAKQAGEEIRLSVSKIQIEKPARVEAKEIEAGISIEKGKIKFDGFLAGGFSVSECFLPGGAALKVTGSVRQTRTGANLQGNAEVLNLPGIEFGFSGTAGVKDSGKKSFALEFSADRTRVNEKTFKPFLKERLDGIEFEALAAADGKIRYSEGKLESDLTVDIRQGHLAVDKIGLEMQNIQTKAGFDDVLGLESRPALTLRVEKILMKKLVIENARVVYTIESPASLLVENANFKWCGGNVSAESFRITPDKKSYDLVLYCDRLKLAGILETVADFEATGDGTVSGRIPVRFDGGDISFEDAFLFTSPGAGGHISLKNSSVITKRIPEETARYTRMDLAREALKDYEYKWAKLLFDTRGEKLHVKLRFDGKPADVLPFEYNRELGRFSRVDASSRGSRFQGIKIDVNLTLPFNQVLKYGKELDKLF